MKKGPATYLFAFLLAVLVVMPGVGWGQVTIFTESMGTVSGTTAIATHETNNGFDNDHYKMTAGNAANPADIRQTNISSGYLGASGGANVWFTNTSGDYGFAIEGIDASTYTSLKIQFGYRKESASLLPNLAFYFWNGSDYINIPFSFNESEIAATGWYLSPEILLPIEAQISDLRLRWIKSGTIAVRIDDIKLLGTISSAPLLTINTEVLSDFSYFEGLGPSAEQSFTVSGSNLTDDITLTPPTNFETSTGTGGSFSPTNPIVLEETGGIVAETIYVRLKAGLTIGNYENEEIIASTEGAINRVVNCSGIVTDYCGLETFDNLSISGTTYVDGNFTGNDGIVWFFKHSTGEQDFPIDEKGLMLRRASDSKLETGLISRGIGSFSLQMRKAFTNADARQLELYVNGVRVGESKVFGNASGEDATIHTFEINEINIPGDFTLLIKNVGLTATNRQTVIDNITWTCYIEPICPTTFHFYRSNQSGNWEDVSTWQASEDGSSWSNAECVPDYRAKGIIIRNGHAVIINEFLRINQTIIESGGTIIRGPGNKRLIINDGPGDDLVVYGVFRHAASLPAPDYQGTIKVKPEGMIEVTNNLTSASHYGVSNKIFYENGSVFYWNVGSSAPFLTSNQTYFPNSGPEKIPIFRLSTPNISVGANSQTIINGIFEVTQNNVNFQNTGDKIFRNGISGPGKVTQASNSGAFIINGTEAKLNIENLDLKGNMNISPTTNILSGSTNLSLTGTNTQTLSFPPPNPDPVRFARITVNNSTGISIDQDIQVKNTLSMQAGNIYNKGKTITVGESLTQTGHIIHENGFIHGKLRRWIPFSTTDNIIFPIGKPGLETPTSVRYTTAPAGGTLAVEFIEEDMGIPPEPVIVIPHTDDCPEFGVEYLSYQGFWRFEPDGLSGGTYDITFNPRGLEIITDICQLTALKRNSGEWQSEGTHVEPEGAIASPIIKRTGVTSGFSDWGIGGGIDNPLPIELLSFTAEYQNKQVLLNWATGSEINNDFFTLERSRDALNAEIIGFVEGAGNSSHTMHYQFVDTYPLPGISYYRLKQTDYDGSFEYSQWVAVEAAVLGGRLQAQAISQPQGLMLRIFTPTERPLQIQLADIYGRIVHSEQLNPGSPGHIETFVPMPQSARSVLLYRITDGLEVVTGKVIR